MTLEIDVGMVDQGGAGGLGRLVGVVVRDVYVKVDAGTLVSPSVGVTFTFSFMMFAPPLAY